MILEGKRARDFIEAHGIHFKPHEFECKCGCGTIKIDSANLVKLDYIRHHIGMPVYINSAYRCEKHNKEVGGKEDSYHLKGMAYDITVKDFDEFKEALINYASYAGFTGIGVYDTFIHVDNGNSRRW